MGENINKIRKLRVRLKKGGMKKDWKYLIRCLVHTSENWRRNRISPIRRRMISTSFLLLKSMN